MSSCSANIPSRLEGAQNRLSTSVVLVASDVVPYVIHLLEIGGNQNSPLRSCPRVISSTL